jgi:hypothetical protein
MKKFEQDPFKTIGKIVLLLGIQDLLEASSRGEILPREKTEKLLSWIDRFEEREQLTLTDMLTEVR